jgi:hypothetical protein
MSENPSLPEAFDHGLLDLLVDGELDAARRRELLLTLEATPGGWRQCALAFLEAQAWSSDLRGAADDPVERKHASHKVAGVGRMPIHRLRNWSLLASCLACAFFARWIVRPTPPVPVAEDPVALAPNPVDRQQVAVTSPVADSPNPAGKIEETDQDLQAIASEPERDPPGVRVTGILTLKFDDHGQEREMRFPVIDAAGIDVRQWLEQASSLNPSAVQALERRGHKVESQRQLVTVNLNDGRKLLMPVDQVDVHFAHRVYQ